MNPLLQSLCKKTGTIEIIDQLQWLAKKTAVRAVAFVTLNPGSDKRILDERMSLKDRSLYWLLKELCFEVTISDIKEGDLEDVINEELPIITGYEHNPSSTHIILAIFFPAIENFDI